jgi:hypothetical protein
VKYRLLCPGTGTVAASGAVERLGEDDATLTHRVAAGAVAFHGRVPAGDHAAAMREIESALPPRTGVGTGAAVGLGSSTRGPVPYPVVVDVSC